MRVDLLASLFLVFFQSFLPRRTKLTKYCQNGGGGKGSRARGLRYRYLDVGENNLRLNPIQNASRLQSRGFERALDCSSFRERTCPPVSSPTKNASKTPTFPPTRKHCVHEHEVKIFQPKLQGSPRIHRDTTHTLKRNRTPLPSIPPAGTASKRKIWSWARARPADSTVNRCRAEPFHRHSCRHPRPRLPPPDQNRLCSM